jgi:hypothetical protein
MNNRLSSVLSEEKKEGLNYEVNRTALRRQR